MEKVDFLTKKKKVFLKKTKVKKVNFCFKKDVLSEKQGGNQSCVSKIWFFLKNSEGKKSKFFTANVAFSLLLYAIKLISEKKTGVKKVDFLTKKSFF